MATNLLNCTVTTYSSLEDVGDGVQLIEEQLITDPVIQNAIAVTNASWIVDSLLEPNIKVLVIEPDPGYTISAPNITLGGVVASAFPAPDNTTNDSGIASFSWSQQFAGAFNYDWLYPNIERITLRNTVAFQYFSDLGDISTIQPPYPLGNKVVATIVLNPTFVMPNNNLTINIDFDGAAVLYEVPQPTATSTLKIIPRGRMLNFFNSDCVGYTSNTSSTYSSGVPGSGDNVSGIFTNNDSCDPDGEFSNQSVFVTGIISDENGNEYHTHQDGPDFLNQDSEASTLIPNNFYGPTHTNSGSDASIGYKSIRFNLEEGDGVLNGNLPQYVYIKFVAFAFSGETFQTGNNAPLQPALPHTPLYINPDNCQPLLQVYGGAISSIGGVGLNNTGQDGTYFPESDMAPFVFSSAISATGIDSYGSQQLLRIEDYQVTEIFPTEGYGTETNAVLVRLELNPNYVFSENLYDSTRLGIALTGLTTQNANGETLDGNTFYYNSYNYLSFEPFTGNGVGFNINIIDEQG